MKSKGLKGLEEWAVKNNSLGVILIIITILAIAFNLSSFINGGYSSFFGSLISFAFIAIWVLVFRCALKNKDYTLIIISIVFWSLTFIIAFLTLYVNITEVDMSFMIPFVVIFLTPLYGLDVIGRDNIITLAIIIAIAISFVWLGLKSIIKSKK